MTKDEALRMAIEALIHHTEQTRPIEDTNKAIQACKEALGVRQMTKNEALRMAIDAMEESKDILEYEGMIPDGYEEAIQACKEALAETQEPVIIKQENGMVLKLGYDELPNGTAFYTTPPSREWQGLKTIDIANLLNDFNIPLHDFDIHLPDCNIPFEWDKKFLAFARATEAKLREKNG